MKLLTPAELTTLFQSGLRMLRTVYRSPTLLSGLERESATHQYVPALEQLPVVHPMAIRPGEMVTIVGRPQRLFRPSQFRISSAGTPGGAGDWVVNDIKIGSRSQFLQRGALPGDMFAANAIDAFVAFEPAQVAMDISVTIMYVGPNESGVPFYGALFGERPCERTYIYLVIDEHLYRIDLVEERWNAAFVTELTGSSSITQLLEQQAPLEERLVQFREYEGQVSKVYAVDERTGLVVLSMGLEDPQKGTRFHFAWTPQGTTPKWLEAS